MYDVSRQYSCNTCLILILMCQLSRTVGAVNFQALHSVTCRKEEFKKDDGCPKGYTVYQKWDSCYKINPQKSTWSKARRNCQFEGGDLVVILDSDMNRFIKREIEKSIQHMPNAKSAKFRAKQIEEAGARNASEIKSPEKRFKRLERVERDVHANNYPWAFWVGLNRLGEHKKFTWLEQEYKPSFTNWVPNFASRNGDCVAVTPSGWTPLACTERLMSICMVGGAPPVLTVNKELESPVIVVGTVLEARCISIGRGDGTLSFNVKSPTDDFDISNNFTQASEYVKIGRSCKKRSVASFKMVVTPDMDNLEIECCQVLRNNGELCDKIDDKLRIEYPYKRPFLKIYTHKKQIALGENRVILCSCKAYVGFFDNLKGRRNVTIVVNKRNLIVRWVIQYKGDVHLSVSKDNRTTRYIPMTKEMKFLGKYGPFHNMQIERQEGFNSTFGPFMIIFVHILVSMEIDGGNIECYSSRRVNDSEISEQFEVVTKEKSVQAKEKANGVVFVAMMFVFLAVILIVVPATSRDDMSEDPGTNVDELKQSDKRIESNPNFVLFNVKHSTPPLIDDLHEYGNRTGSERWMSEAISELDVFATVSDADVNGISSRDLLKNVHPMRRSLQMSHSSLSHHRRLQEELKNIKS